MSHQEDVKDFSLCYEEHAGSSNVTIIVPLQSGIKLLVKSHTQILYLHVPLIRKFMQNEPDLTEYSMPLTLVRREGYDEINPTVHDVKLFFDLIYDVPCDLKSVNLWNLWSVLHMFDFLDCSTLKHKPIIEELHLRVPSLIRTTQVSDILQHLQLANSLQTTTLVTAMSKLLCKNVLAAQQADLITNFQQWLSIAVTHDIQPFQNECVNALSIAKDAQLDTLFTAACNDETVRNQLIATRAPSRILYVLEKRMIKSIERGTGANKFHSFLQRFRHWFVLELSQQPQQLQDNEHDHESIDDSDDQDT